MEFASHQSYQVFFMACFLLACIAGVLTLVYLKKRKANINSPKSLCLAILVAIPITLLPIWISGDVMTTTKIEASIIGFGVAFLNLLFLALGDKFIKGK